MKSNMPTDQELRRVPATQPIDWPDVDELAGYSFDGTLRPRPRVLVVDHGFANTLAVDRMLRRAQIRATISSEPAAVGQATHIILPGVGHFDAVRDRLNELGILMALNEARGRGAAVLGICVGMQLMFEGSDEGNAEGLGWIKGRCHRLAPKPGSGSRIPHMGWNRVDAVGEARILGGAAEKFYFLHSYAAVPDDQRTIIGRCNYGGDNIVVAVRDGRSFGVQFHPEKSHRFGCDLLARFTREDATIPNPN